MAAHESHADVEWEYEYDEHDTEDVYITVDLTTHVPPTFTYTKRSRNSRTSQARGSNKSLANVSKPAAVDLELDTPQASRLQLVDFHGDNPILSFDNALYTCQWATDVGTSLYLSAPQPDADPEHPPLRSKPSFDLLGTDFARLIAIPTTITPRAAPLSRRDSLPDIPNHQSYTTQDGDIIKHTNNEGIQIQLPATASSAKVAQARFLERLSAIKAKSGDMDAVPITNIKIFRHPEGWEEERDKWIAKETESNSRDRLEADLRRNSRRTLGQSNRPRDESAETEASPGVEEAGQDAEPITANNLDMKNMLQTRKKRGGPKPGPTSGKRLRESLGLPEARRDKKIHGLPPRRVWSDAEIPELARLSAADRDGSAAEDDVEELEALAGADAGADAPEDGPTQE